jgi:hypothetical protein
MMTLGMYSQEGEDEEWHPTTQVEFPEKGRGEDATLSRDLSCQRKDPLAGMVCIKQK